MILRKHEGNQIALTGEKDEIEFSNEYELSGYMADYLFSD
jgi:hypothetical protein